MGWILSRQLFNTFKPPETFRKRCRTILLYQEMRLKKNLIEKKYFFVSKNDFHLKKFENFREFLFILLVREYMEILIFLKWKSFFGTKKHFFRWDFFKSYLLVQENRLAVIAERFGKFKAAGCGENKISTWIIPNTRFYF